MKEPLRIAVNLPYIFSVRDFLFTPVWDEMGKRKNVDFIFLSHNEQVGSVFSLKKPDNITFLKFYPSNRKSKSLIHKCLRRVLGSRIWNKYFATFCSEYVFSSLLYRFAAINNLSHYKIRKRKSRSERKRYQIFSDYKNGEVAGFPFPKSKIIFRFMYRHFYDSTKNACKEDID